MKKLAYLLLVAALFAALAAYSGCAGQTGRVEDTTKPGLPGPAVPEDSSTVIQKQTGTIAPDQSTYEEPDSVTTPTPPGTSVESNVETETASQPEPASQSEPATPPAPPTSEPCTTPA